LPVNEALVVAGREIADPVGNELRRALDQVQIGVQMVDALQQTADRVRVTDFRFMVVALALQQKTGGSLAETLGNLSKGDSRPQSAASQGPSTDVGGQGVSSSLAALPFVVGGAMYVVNRDLGSALFVDPRGRFTIGVAFLSLVTGLSTMAVLVKRAPR